MEGQKEEASKSLEEALSGSTRKLSFIGYKHLDADKLLSAFGKYGKYQMRSYSLLSIVLIIYSAQMMIMGFIAVPPSFECEIIQPDDGPRWEYTALDECRVADANNWTLACNDVPHSSFKFNESSPHTTLNSEFNLVCRDEHWAQHASSLFMIGGMVITPLVTQLSDLYGRRMTFLIPLWVAVAASIACAAAPTYGVFLFFRFIAGIGTTGFSTIGWVLACESVAVEFRSLLSFVGTFTWVTGIMLVGVLRLWIESWRMLYLAISLPGLLTVFYYWYMPESLHWMITHNKQEGIKRYIKHSSRFNNVEVDLTACVSKASENAEEKSRTFFDMIRNKAIVFHLLVHCLIMMIMNVAYWGLALFSTTLSEDGYTGYFLSGLVEIPAGFIGILLILKFGRRTVTFWMLALQGVSMGVATLYPGRGTFQMIFPVAAKLFNSIVWASEPLLLAEMSPTSIRNVFYGIVQFFAEIGSVLAPYLNLLKAIDERAPQTAVAVMSLLAAVLVLSSPETKDKPMPEDLDQFDPGCLLRKLGYCTKKSRNDDVENNEAESQAMISTSSEDDKSCVSGKISSTDTNSHEKSNLETEKSNLETS